MEFLRPSTWAEALEAKAAHPDAVPVAGGTDVMVELNFDHRRPSALLDLTAVDELTECSVVDGRIRLGAGVTYARIIDELAGSLPGLAMAARTVGSPQIRNRGTVGGNLGSASPAGDAHPPLLTTDAVVELASVRGTRMLPVAEFLTGVKRNALAPDELIAAAHIAPADGPQQFSKVGTRNAMVIAVCALALAVHPGDQRVDVAIGSAAPTPRRCPEAEAFLSGALRDQWVSPRPVGPAVAKKFGDLVATAAEPIDDVRATAGYRRHALGVLAARTLTWAWRDYGTERWPACA